MIVRPSAARSPGARTLRRSPVDWRAYAAQAARARSRLPRTEHPLAVRAVVSLVFTLAGLLLLQLIGVGVAAGIADIGRSVVKQIPQPTSGALVLGEPQVNIAAAPVLDPLPDFTRNSSVALAGSVPPFALSPGRTISVAVNGSIVGIATIGPDGRFGPTTLALVDGANVVTATLVDGTRRIASASATVILDRVPPALTIASPRAGDAVTGPDVTVSGTTQPGASVIVNDQVILPDPDGSFTERITGVPSGPFTISVVATDKAGNEAKTSLSVTVKPAASPAATGLSLGITLDRTAVRPGQTVVAQIVATEDAKPKADVAVTLQVGVITIGTYHTDATGVVRVGFAAPPHDAQSVTVLALGGGTSATTTLAVSSSAP